MANNYVIFDKNGLLADSQLSPISKGNNKVDTFYISFADYDYNNTYVTVATTLPNGDALPELGTSISNFTFKENDYKGYKFIVLEPLTKQAGVETLTFHLKSKEDDARLCSARLNVPIHDSDVATEPTITDAQYENITVTIDTGLKDLEDKKLDKDFNVYRNVTKASEEDLVPLRRQQENVNIKVNDFYNILTINGIQPVNKNIELTAGNINIDGITVQEKLAELDEEKASVDLLKTKVSYRDGNFEDVEHYIPTGTLSHITEEIFDVYDFARITLVDTEFQEGDLLTCDLNLTFVNNTGETTTTCSFTRLLAQGNFYQRMVVSTGTEIIPVSIYMIVNGSYLAMRVINTSEYAIKPSVEYAIIRR